MFRPFGFPRLIYCKIYVLTFEVVTLCPSLITRYFCDFVYVCVCGCVCRFIVGKYGGVPFTTEVMTNNVTRLYGVWKLT